MIRGEIVPNQLALLLNWNVFEEGLDCLEQLTFVVTVYIGHREEAHRVQVLHELGNDFGFGQAHVDGFKLYHVVRVDHRLRRNVIVHFFHYMTCFLLFFAAM